MITHGSRSLVVLDGDDEARGVVTLDVLAELGQGGPNEPLFLAQSEEPVIPDFGEGTDCVVENRLFCPDWVRDNWGGVIQPALLEHVKLMLIAVAIGFVIAFVAAIVAHRYRLLGEAGHRLLGGRVHDPEPRALPAPRPGDRPHRDHGRDRARRLHAADPLPEHRSRGSAACPPDVLEAARGMGYTRRQTLWRVELPLAVPAMMAGLRVADRLHDRARDGRRARHPGGPRLPDLPRAPRVVQDGDHRRGRARGRARARRRRAARRSLERALTPWARVRRTT